MPVSRSDPECPNSCSWALNATPTSYLLLLICLSAEAIQSILITALGPSTPRQHLTCCMTEIVRTRREVVPFFAVCIKHSSLHLCLSVLSPVDDKVVVSQLVPAAVITEPSSYYHSVPIKKTSSDELRS